MKFYKLIAAASVGAFALAGGVQAATISAVFAKNGDAITAINMGSTPSDCAGYFGSGFSDCDVGTPLDVKESGSIAKYDAEGLDWEVNTAYRSDLSSAFTLTNAGAGNGTGSFTYAATAGDPGVRFWAAKQSTSFRLYWNVADALITDGTCKVGDNIFNYNVNCIAGAYTVTSGSWTTPKGNGLSHVTFYNGDTPPVVPLPAAGWMLMAGLGGLAAMRRRKH